MDVTTISGDVTVNGEMLGGARLKSTNGRLKVEAGLAAAGRFDLTTTNGRIEVMLDSDQDLDLDVETLSGSISNCFGIEPTRQSKYGPGRVLRFKQGQADRSVRARSLSGGVEICSNAKSG